MSDFEKRMGEHYEISRRSQRLVCRAAYIMAGITTGVGGVNYFIEPDERMTYTAMPLAGSVAICGLAKIYDAVHNSLQDKILEYGMRDFSKDLDDQQ